MDSTSRSRKSSRERQDDVPLAKSAPSFVRFNDLEKKVRLKIWEFALPGQRVVFVEQYWGTSLLDTSRVALNKDADRESEEKTQMDNCEPNVKRRKITGMHDKAPPGPGDIWRSATPAPVILYVCHESRNVALEGYSRIFAHGNVFSGIWFNFHLDILFLDWEWRNGGIHLYTPKNLCKYDCQRVENLAILDCPLYTEQTDEKWLAGILSEYSKTKYLYIVDWHRKPYPRANLVLLDKMDVDGFITFYGTPYTARGERDFIRTMPSVFPNKYIVVDNDLLEKHMIELTEGGLSSWSMPEIQQKIATSLGVVKRLHEAKERYLASRRDALIQQMIKEEYQEHSGL